MLGWPSPTYPKLLQPDAPIQINMNQSAMITGFLMIGVSLGTIVSTKQIFLRPKPGIVLGNMLICLGWIAMWQSRDVFWLLGSRILVGAGHGYAMGQIKLYILEMSDGALRSKFIQRLNFYAVFGVVTAFAMGPFVTFRKFSVICGVISATILFLVILLPSTPKELIRAKKVDNAKRLIVYIKPDSDPDIEVCKIIQSISSTTECNGFTKMMRNSVLRIKFVKFTILVICQQYCGAPPTLVYTEIIFTESNVRYPELFAIGYAVLFFISIIIGTLVSHKFNKKTVLLLSCCGTLVLYIGIIVTIFFNVNDEYFSYTTVIIMYLYIVVYTVGLGTIPFTLISDWFPKSYCEFTVKYYIVLFSLLALTITKIFQVLIGFHELYVPFYLFSGVISFAIIFILIYFPTTTKESDEKQVVI